MQFILPMYKKDYGLQNLSCDLGINLETFILNSSVIKIPNIYSGINALKIFLAAYVRNLIRSVQCFTPLNIIPVRILILVVTR